MQTPKSTIFDMTLLYNNELALSLSMHRCSNSHVLSMKITQLPHPSRVLRACHSFAQSLRKYICSKIFDENFCVLPMMRKSCSWFLCIIAPIVSTTRKSCPKIVVSHLIHFPQSRLAGLFLHAPLVNSNFDSFDGIYHQVFVEGTGKKLLVKGFFGRFLSAKTH